VHAQRAHPRRELLVIGDERASVTHRAEILRRVEAEGGCAACTSCANAVP
jgi:hypothetical protein